MSLFHSPRIVTNNLILCLDAGNTRSYPGIGTIWSNLSSGITTTILINNPTYTSSNSGSIVFDGTNDYAVLPTDSILTFSGDFTFDCWISPNSLTVPTASNSIWSLSTAQTLQMNNNPTIIYYDGLNTRSFTTLSIGSWYNVVLSKTGTNITGYLNNTSYFSVFNSSTHNFSGAAIAYRTLDPPGYYWNGNISSIKIYNRGLTSSEVAQNFSAYRGRYRI